VLALAGGSVSAARRWRATGGEYYGETVKDQVLPGRVVAKALDTRDDLLQVGVGEFPQEHFGDLDLARPQAVSAELS
jgi:hypothetical protein